jgi:hypothetical protein
VAETSTNSFPEPDNTETLAYIEGRLALHVNPRTVAPDHDLSEHEVDFDDWLKTQD